MMHEDGPVTYSIDRVAPKPLRWLWDGPRPRGNPPVLASDPALGQSLRALDVPPPASSLPASPCRPPVVRAPAPGSQLSRRAGLACV